MLLVPKTKSIGYKTGTEAQAARERLGKGSVKEGTTGTWYHEIEFQCPTIELGKANEDIDAIAARLGLTPAEVLTACNNGIYLKARTQVEDGTNPEATKSAARLTAEAEIVQWCISHQDFSLITELSKEGLSGGQKAKNAWLDDFIAAGGVAGIATSGTAQTT